MTKMIQPPLIDEKEIDQVIFESFQELVEMAEENFAISYSNWENENKPNFYTTQKAEGNKFSVEYSTEDNPYVWVDDGTEGHKITAKNFPVMTFPTKNIPRTRPGQLTSFQPARTGWTSAKEVNHPGIKPRNFSGVVQGIMDENMEVVFDSNFKEVKSF